MNKIIILILVALVLRLAMLPAVNKLFVTDAKQYYQIAEILEVPLEVTAQYGFTKWYEWSPVHILFLHLTNRILAFQILLSVLTVFILSKVNIKLAWFWCLYPVAIAFSVTYFKENLLFFCFATILYFSIRNKWYILLIFPVTLLFTGYGAYNYNQSISLGFASNMIQMWKPGFHILRVFGDWTYILAVPYTILIIAFIRYARFNLNLVVIVLYSLIYCLVYGAPRFREPILILLVYEVIKKPD